MMNARWVVGTALLALCFCSPSLYAQDPDPDYELVLSSSSGTIGDLVTISSRLNFPNGEPLQGYSFGVCTDDTRLQLNCEGPQPPPNPNDCTENGVVVEGEALAATNGGTGPDFFAPAVVPGGFTVGAVINLLGGDFVAAQSNAELLRATYEVVDGANSSAPVEYCSTLGTPQVLISVAVVGVGDVPPVIINGAVEITPENFLTVAKTTGTVGGDAAVPVSLTNVDPVDAVQVGLAYDAAVLAGNSVSAAGPLLAAEFFEFTIDASAPGEITVGAVMDLTAPIGNTDPIPAGEGVEILSIGFSVLGTVVAPTSTPLTLETVGSPPIENLLTVAGEKSFPGLIDGAMNIINFNAFVRGDCNRDDQVDIADGVFLLNFLFQAGPAPDCLDACDANDDAPNFPDSSDAIYIFNYRFLDGPQPLAPFPLAGIDPTLGDGLGCDGDADD